MDVLVGVGIDGLADEGQELLAGEPRLAIADRLPGGSVERANRFVVPCERQSWVDA